MYVCIFLSIFLSIYSYLSIYLSIMKVWEDDSLNKSGVLKHVKDIIAKVRKITEKLAKVFQYVYSMVLDILKAIFSLPFCAPH